jgi:ATP-dependent DNA helicase RecG
MAGRPLSFLANVDVDEVKGIGQASAKKLGTAGIRTVADLLLYAPRRYLDRSQLYALADVPLGVEVTVAGTVLRVSQRDVFRRGRRNLKITEATIGDDSGLLSAVWFNPYLKLKEGAEVALSGKAESFRGRLQMKSPDIDSLEGESLTTGRVVPVHGSVGGLTPPRLRVSIENALRRSRPIAEALPAEILDRQGLVDRDTAIADIHFPEALESADAARKRLVFDEFFRLEVALAMRKHAQIEAAVGVAHVRKAPRVDAFIDALPFDLTGAQERVIAEIQADMAAPHPMHRLLQGEVGSGKTVVAVAAMLTAVEGGYQGAVMAPTEVLAEQHYLGIRGLLADAGLAPTLEGRSDPEGMDSLFADGKQRPAIKVALLTSNTAELNYRAPGSAARSEVVDAIGAGEVDVVVGTHALIQEGLHFHRLGAAVVDEQHRFGVYQRVMLREKADDYDPDLLIMTATPIPRTLAMTLYGDLDVSDLDEMPAGRTPVETVHVAPTDGGMKEVYDLVRAEAAEGRQIFVVCPLVAESDKLEVAAATSEYERLQSVFPDLRLGLLHGQLRPSDKDGVMSRFRDKEIDVLVATTVIEVGIDVPNATLMVIEDADRFGLSQLHQLRGRVGRGAHRSRCVLIADPSTPEGEERIAAMVASNDGFELAEQDLRIRGQGTVFDTRQSGVADLRLADILRDRALLVAARKEAFGLVRRDPDLKGEPELRAEIEAFLGEKVDWLFKS